MNLLDPNDDGFTEDEYAAFAGALGGDEDQTTEFAVIYVQRGEYIVEGPFNRRQAERVAGTRHGARIAERTVTITRGLWVPADERMAEFDKSE